MNRTYLTLKMLQYLHSYGMLSRNELAEKLEVNPRNIYEYKKDLIMLGYDIQSVPGRGGGYKINDDYIMKLPKLSDKEQIGLRALLGHMYKLDISLGDEYSMQALEKVCNECKCSFNNKSEYIVKNQEYDSTNERIIYSKIKNAIEASRIIKITYHSYNGRSSKMLHPYSLINVKSIWYLVAFDVNAAKYKTFKISRMKNFEMTSTKFFREPSYRVQNFVDSIGLKLEKECRVKLKIKGVSIKYIMENPIGTNINIINEENFIYYEANIRGEFLIADSILRMGSNCEVISPSSLRHKIVGEIEQMVNLYDM